MENSEKIFAIALGLGAPWSIEKVVFNNEISQLDIYLKFEKGYKFKMEDGR